MKKHTSIDQSLSSDNLSACTTVAVDLATTAGEPVVTATSTLLHTWPKEDA